MARGPPPGVSSGRRNPVAFEPMRMRLRPRTPLGLVRPLTRTSSQKEAAPAEDAGLDLDWLSFRTERCKRLVKKSKKSQVLFRINRKCKVSTAFLKRERCLLEKVALVFKKLQEKADQDVQIVAEEVGQQRDENKNLNGENKTLRTENRSLHNDLKALQIKFEQQREVTINFQAKISEQEKALASEREARTAVEQELRDATAVEQELRDALAVAQAQEDETSISQPVMTSLKNKSRGNRTSRVSTVSNVSNSPSHSAKKASPTGRFRRVSTTPVQVPAVVQSPRMKPRGKSKMKPKPKVSPQPAVQQRPDLEIHEGMNYDTDPEGLGSEGGTTPVPAGFETDPEDLANHKGSEIAQPLKSADELRALSGGSSPVVQYTGPPVGKGAKVPTGFWAATANFPPLDSQLHRPVTRSSLRSVS